MDQEIQSIVKRIRDTSSFIIADLELKNIESDQMSLYGNNPNLIFPTRVWDSYQLWGSQEMNSMIREIVSREIIGNPKLATRFYDRLRSHIRVNKSGEYRINMKTNTQFSIQKNEFYYNPTEYIEGIKM